MAAHHLHEDIAGGLTELSQLRCKLARPLQISSSPMIGPLAPQGEQQRTRPVQRRRELACSGVHLAEFRRAPAPARDERLTEGDPQIELGFPAPIAVGQDGNQRQPPMEQRDGFRGRRARPGLPPGGKPIRDRLLRQTGFGAVVGEQRRLGRDNLVEPVFEGGGDAGMELLAPARSNVL